MGIPTIFDFQYIRQSLSQIDCNDSDKLIEKKDMAQEDKNIVRELIASLRRIAKIRTNSIEPDEEEIIPSQQNKGRKQMLSELGVDVPNVSVQNRTTNKQKIIELNKGSEREGK